MNCIKHNHRGESPCPNCTGAPTFPTGVVPRAMPEGAVGDINSEAKGSGARFNAGKPPLDLIPLRIIADSYARRPSDEGFGAYMALHHLAVWQETGAESELMLALRSLGNQKEVWAECARVFDYGRKKYAAWNWAKGMAWSIPLACAARHLMEVLEGHPNDAESGEPHRGHVACNIVMALTFLRTYPEGNDLPKVLV